MNKFDIIYNGNVIEIGKHKENGQLYLHRKNSVVWIKFSSDMERDLIRYLLQAEV